MFQSSSAVRERVPLMLSVRADAFNALQFFIPAPQNRLPRNSQHAWFYSLAVFLLVMMAGLARRRGTWSIRLALFPFAMFTMLRFIYGFVGRDEPINRAFGMWGLQYCLKLMDYVHSPDPMLKLSEAQADKDAARPSQPPATTSSALLMVPFSFVYDAFELLFTFRGFDWQFGIETGIRRPREWLPATSRALFALKSVFIVLRDLLLCDIIQTTIHMASLGGIERGSMFAFGGGNLILRYSVSTTLHILSGVAVMYRLEFIYTVFSLIGVLLCGSNPSSWPPLFDSPWISTSLHDFWGRRWHQLFRRSFLIGGGYPLAAAVGWMVSVRKKHAPSSADGATGKKKSSITPAALAIGTCLVSGLVHNGDYYAQRDSRMPGVSTIAFFATQGVAMALEREWKRMTGRQVNGIWGWLWVFIWMAVLAQPFMETWHQLGFLDSLFILRERSPTRLFIIPFFRSKIPNLIPEFLSLN
ncbi:hypothetical protein DL93DRAFT_794859 [Clavulina sp. PMI_390]|nr:hypothetical protein DL93DRAFT_794859 [Clavulina sp. PMI_390]